MKKILIGTVAIMAFMAITTLGAILVTPLVNKWIPYSCDTAEAKYQTISYRYYTYVSWYGKKFHGRKMANGWIYNMYDPSIAAHKTLPFGREVKLTNPKNGRSIIVIIKDRGPFIPGREFDISYAAAKKLDIVKQGVALLKIEFSKI